MSQDATPVGLNRYARSYRASALALGDIDLKWKAMVQSEELIWLRI